MRAFTMLAAGALVALTGALATAQAPAKIATLQDHAMLMKSNARTQVATLARTSGRSRRSGRRRSATRRSRSCAMA